LYFIIILIVFYELYIFYFLIVFDIYIIMDCLLEYIRHIYNTPYIGHAEIFSSSYHGSICLSPNSLVDASSIPLPLHILPFFLANHGYVGTVPAGS